MQTRRYSCFSTICTRASNGVCMSLRACIHVQTNTTTYSLTYEGHLESKERFAIKKYLLIIGKKQNMQVLSHTFTYFST